MHKPHIFCTNCISVPDHYQAQAETIFLHSLPQIFLAQKKCLYRPLLGRYKHRNTKNKGMLYSLLYSSFLHFEHCAYVGCWLLSISQMVSLNTPFSAFTFSFPPYFSAIACMLFMP